jgi:hypothetical protein
MLSKAGCSLVEGWRLLLEPVNLKFFLLFKREILVIKTWACKFGYCNCILLCHTAYARYLQFTVSRDVKQKKLLNEKGKTIHYLIKKYMSPAISICLVLHKGPTDLCCHHVTKKTTLTSSVADP